MERTHCPMCGADRARRLLRNFGLDLSRCRACGLVYAGPDRLTPAESRERYNSTYFAREYLPAFRAVGDTVDLAALRTQYARTLAHIRPFRHLGSLLEVGSGAGLFLKVANDDGWRVTGIDVMEAGAQFTRARLGVTVHAVALEDAPFERASCDVIVMLEVIEHLPDPVAAVQRVRALLRPGGCLALTTPNVSSLTRWGLGRNWAVLSPAEHLCLFDERTLRALLTQTGFTAVHFDRHYAGVGAEWTLRPAHAFDPKARRARVHRRLVETFGPRTIRAVQARGLADWLHCYAQAPDEPLSPPRPRPGVSVVPPRPRAGTGTPAVGQAAPVIRGRIGLDPGTALREIAPDDQGIFHVSLPATDGVELLLGRVTSGSRVVDGQLQDLPAWSHLDTATGAFVWFPAWDAGRTCDLSFLGEAGPLRVRVRLLADVTADPGKPQIRMNIDWPSAAAEITEGSVLRGWALDPQAAFGAGIDPIQVWARPVNAPGSPGTFLGAARLNEPSPDGARAFGPQFTHAGFSVPVSGLERGEYDVTVYAFAIRTARWEDARTVRMTVR